MLSSAAFLTKGAGLINQLDQSILRRRPELLTAAQRIGGYAISDGRSRRVPKPTRRSVGWTSFVGTPVRGRIVRGLQEEGNPAHRLRVEHNRDTLLIHLADEDGQGWTTLALNRATREWSVAQRQRQVDAAKTAYEQLYD